MNRDCTRRKYRVARQNLLRPHRLESEIMVKSNNLSFSQHNMILDLMNVIHTLNRALK